LYSGIDCPKSPKCCFDCECVSIGIELDCTYKVNLGKYNLGDTHY